MAVAKILVVEDEGLTAMEIQRKLKNWGYDVPSFAFSRKEAVKKAKEIKPDLILMDIMLKGKGDGVDAAQEIKNVHDIPIIYLTAYDDVGTRKRAEITNPTAYLIKPFEEKELQSKIETALSEHNLEKKLLKIGKGLDNKLEDFGVIVVDFKSRIIYLNNLASDLTGFKQESVKYNDLGEVFPIEDIKDISNVENQLKTFIKENTGVPARSILNKDGNDVHIEYNINSIIGKNDGFLGAELVFKDITHQIKDEKSLMEREEKFRDIYHQSMLATEIFDENGNLLDANPACLDLFGASDANQLKEFNLFKDFKLESKEEQILQGGSEVKSECEFNFEELKDMGFESTVLDKDKYLSLFITPLELDGAVNGYLVQFQDVTDHHKLEESLKDNQERYLGFLDTLDQVLIVFNDDLRCVYCNKVINELLDFKSDDLIGKSVQEVMTPFWDEEMEIRCKETLEEGKPSCTVKTIQKDKIPSHIEIKAFKSSDGLMFILNDVTQDQQRERELKRNENLYRSVVNDQSEIICRFNKDFELTFANEAYNNIFGLKIKFNNENTVFSLSEEDKGKMKSQFKSFNEENPIKIFEGPIKMPNGDISWWQWVTRANFDKEGNISEYQSVGHNVTQQHQTIEEIQNKMEKLQFSIKEKNRELEDIRNSFKLEIEGKSKELDEVRESFKLEIEGKSKELDEVRESFKFEFEEKKKELEEVRESSKGEIEERNQKIDSIMKLNESMNIKFKEESQKLTETIKNQTNELKILKETETVLKESLKLLERDVHSKKIEADDLSKALEAEIALRKKTEEKLQKTTSNLKEQLSKADAALSDINGLKKEIQEKESEISELKTDFEAEISKLKTDFKSEIANLERLELKTRESLEQKEKALKNVHNGVKKNMRMISTLNRLHSEYVTDQMIEKLQDGRSYLRSFGMVHEKLYESKDLETVNLNEYLSSILDDISRSHGAKDIDIQIKTGDIYLNMETAVLSGLIISELVINSLKHAFPESNNGKIMVDVSDDDYVLVINVSDDGVGIPPHISVETVDSFGLQLVKTFVKQSDGDMELKEGVGADFVIKIPKDNKL